LPTTKPPITWIAPAGCAVWAVKVRIRISTLARAAPGTTGGNEPWPRTIFICRQAQRLAQLEAERAAALADLAAHKATGDRDSAAAAIQQIANLDVELQNLGSLYRRYEASQNPPKPPEPTLEERRAKP
jgi:hypothetical protein